MFHIHSPTNRCWFFNCSMIRNFFIRVIRITEKSVDMVCQKKSHASGAFCQSNGSSGGEAFVVNGVRV